MLHSYVEGESNYSPTRRAEISIKFVWICLSCENCICSEYIVQILLELANEVLEPNYKNTLNALNCVVLLRLKSNEESRISITLFIP